MLSSTKITKGASFVLCFVPEFYENSQPYIHILL